jgi:hypothetical protein
MNNQKIQNIIDTLQGLLDEDPPTILELELDRQEKHVMLAICRANIRVPNAVVRISTDIETDEVARLLDRIRHKIGG